MNKREQNIAEHIKTCLNAVKDIDFTDHKDMVSRSGNVIQVKYFDDANPKWSHTSQPKWNTIFTLNVHNRAYIIDSCGYNTKMTVTRLNTVLNAVNANKIVCIKNKKLNVIDMKSNKTVVCESGIFIGKLTNVK